MSEFRRPDGREPSQLRPVRFTTGYLDFSEGSCLVEFGRTRVVCAASIEEWVPGFLHGSGRGWVTAEYSMLPRSTPTRTRREVTQGRPSGRTQEIQRLIGRSLRSVTDMRALGERTITVDCDCLVADGGTRTAAITGGFVALAEAARTLVEQGRLQKMPFRDHVAAVSVGILKGVVCVDLNYEEDSQADVDMNVVMTGKGAFVEVQGTAEQEPFDAQAMQRMIDAATAGISDLVAAQHAALGS